MKETPILAVLRKHPHAQIKQLNAFQPLKFSHFPSALNLFTQTEKVI